MLKWKFSKNVDPQDSDFSIFLSSSFRFILLFLGDAWGSCCHEIIEVFYCTFSKMVIKRHDLVFDILANDPHPHPPSTPGVSAQNVPEKNKGRLG